MACLIVNRGGTKSNAVVYYYTTRDGQRKKIMESYRSLEVAEARKALIEDLESSKMHAEITACAEAYKRDKTYRMQLVYNDTRPDDIKLRTDTTLRVYSDAWLAAYAKRRGLAPETLGSYRRAFDLHILPLLGDRMVASINSADVDSLITRLRETPCKGFAAQNNPNAPMMGAASINRTVGVLLLCLKDAVKYGILDRMPVADKAKAAPQPRRAWSNEQVMDFLERCDDPHLHIAVHLTYIGSLRPGEAAGITRDALHLDALSVEITQTIQSAYDSTIKGVNKDKILKVYPKITPSAKSTLIAKQPKTEHSKRVVPITPQLVEEIEAVLADNAARKAELGDSYHDFGLLLCHADGIPYDPKSFNPKFRAEQDRQGIPIEAQIDFYGLRKSGQMTKLRLSGNDYQLAAAIGGHTPKVLMSNYNEARADEKTALAALMAAQCYVGVAPAKPEVDATERILALLRTDPSLVAEIEAFAEAKKTAQK